MSDDEGGEDYGEYEEDIAGGADDAELDAEPEAEAEPEDDEEVGLDEDAAGTDDEDEEDEGEGEADEGEEDTEPAGASQKAQPQRQKIDPILRVANKHRVIRIVPPDERVTDNRLQKSEAAYVIAMRAEQIAKYATCFTEAPTLHDPVAKAFKELYDRRCPLTLQRLVGTGPFGEAIVEEWTVREMTLPPLTPPVPLGAFAGSSARGEAQRK